MKENGIIHLIHLGCFQFFELRDLINMTAKKGWVAQSWDWRSKEYNNNLNGNGVIETWHADGDSGLRAQTKYFIVWSSCETTLIRLPDRTVYEPADGELLVVNNETCLHKKRKDIGHGRLFARGLGAQKIRWRNNCESRI